MGAKINKIKQNAPMKTIDFLKIVKELMKVMSTLDLRRDDYRHIELYEEHMRMRGEGEKVDYILATLSSKYKLSESTIKRIIKRLSKEVKT